MCAVLTFMLLSFTGLAQQAITGKVTSSEDGQGIPGVSVMIKGTNKGTTTDANGTFKINSSTAKDVLVFSAIGYSTSELAVGTRNTINVVLNVENQALSEVVVVGYGTQKKSQLTGAISQVSAKQISEMPITNLGQALQGRTAGVDVSQSGSKPGQTAKILIRGRRSFNAGNDPLYVVDGIPLSAGYEDFNPNDVQSMEVLKDATATAIYGARGANGVVLITTKRGAVKGKTTVTYDMYVGESQVLNKLRLFNGTEFAEYVREAYRATGIYKNAAGAIVPTGQSDPVADSKVAVLGGDPNVVEGLAQGRSTDYQDLLLKNGFQQNHSIGIQGGNDRTQFYISAGYYVDKGVTEGLDYSRYSLRANIDHEINKWLKVGISSYMMFSDRNGENLNPYSFTIQQNPLGAPYKADGSINFTPTNDALLTNPLAEIVPGAQVDNTKKYRIFNSIYTEVKLMEGLKYRVNFGPDFTLSRWGRFIGAQTNARKGGDPQASSQSNFGFNWTLENIINYSKTVQKHNLNVTLLHSIQRDRYENYAANVQGIPAETQQFYNMGNASSVLGVGSNLTEWTINSLMARVNYDYNDKFLVTLTMRRDGSSRFGVNSKYGNFPGVAVGYNISNEPFLKSVQWLDLLKVRAGWGSVGNQGVSPYQTQGLLNRTAYAWDNTAAFGYRPNTIGNPDLRWETSATKNIGFDFSFLKGRVQGSLELYQTNTTDLLLSDQLPGSIGFSAVTKNVGETRNRGIELSVSTVNVDTKGGFKWTTDFQFTKNQEAIVSLYNGAKDDIGNKWFIGQPLNSFFDYKKVGIWQVSEAEQAKKYYPGDNANALGAGVGQIKVQDTNGDGVINADDRVLLGSDVPTFQAGITNRFSYKNFDISFFLFGRFGQMIVSGFHQDNNALAGRYQQIKVDYWTPNNPNAEFPRPFSNQEFPQYRQTLIYFDGSFIKMRNINFGYTFNSTVAKKFGMESLRLFSSIQQPFIWSSFISKYNGVDPETSGTSVNNGVTPSTRVFTVGINAKF
ncbi:SusC/RagA family TonB-linked outer membrane protein [Flectobacillus longus]|uniref:SusC/RagA family TonB-linked outer membrane protein n=1 Tax=Flectobacillus longus TaxID=2984207 RepID=UPI0024B7443F|nr:TonB-dependent receptor [Flectobacillus longus]MDI9879818.1 TonB-dependent receptor [Flectobacillus longus]